VRTLAADLTDPDAADRVIEAAADAEVGLFIHNAGANTHGKPFLDGDPAAFRRVVDLNVTAPLTLAHHFGRPMRERGRGGILLVGSLSGYNGAATQSVYGGAKAFVQTFAESLWVELREYGVDVLALVLGVTRTPAMERVGLRFDLPGMVVAEPADVAREGLVHLPHGPVLIASGNEKKAAQPRRTRRTNRPERCGPASRPPPPPSSGRPDIATARRWCSKRTSGSGRCRRGDLRGDGPAGSPTYRAAVPLSGTSHGRRAGAAIRLWPTVT
jgi:short-subunit dehydrogenase